MVERVDGREYVFGESGGELELVDGGFVDAADSVEEEESAEQNGECEYLGIVTLVLLQRVAALTVHEEHNRVGVGFQKGFRPHPHSLSACLRSVLYIEPSSFDVQKLVQDETLPCSILTCYACQSYFVFIVFS